MRIDLYKLLIVILLIIFFILLFNNKSLSMFIISRSYIFEINKINSKILDYVKKYNISESAYTNVYYTDQDSNYINLIMLSIDTYYPLILSDFNLEKDKKVNVVIYPTEDKMYNALGLEIKEIAMGIYYGGVLNLLSPNIWINENSETLIKDKFIKEGPIVHELTHLVLDIKTTGNYPLWFTEGVALYYEHKYTGFQWYPELKNDSRSIKLEDLLNNFRNLDEALAYRRCFDIINHLVSKQGEEKLQKLIGKLAEGQYFDKAFIHTYRRPLNIIDTL